MGSRIKEDFVKRLYLISIGLLLSAAAQSACPITECNYSDPQYQIAATAWSNCTTESVNRWQRGIEVLAINYPRFGIAWSAQKTDTNNAGTDQVALTEARQRFNDRILSTAEAEALQYYNLFRLKLDQQMKQCGATPEPPRGQPQ